MTMAGSRALKQVVRTKKVSGKKESSKTPKTRQYQQTGPKHTGPNYPQWRLGMGPHTNMKEEMMEGE